MIALITGGASGLGEAVTKRIASDKANTVYFTFCKSEVNAKNIEIQFPNAISIKCNFENEADVNSLKEKIESFNIDVLINNAFTGETVKSHFNKINPSEFLADFKNNIIPTIITTQAAINCFRKKKSGKIITVLTSFLVNTPPIGTSVYVANKAYLEKLTKVWATENIKYNITSNSVSPSFMQTPLTNNVDERVIEQLKENHPLKMILRVEEVAETVFHLVNASSQINGVDIVLNAGTNVK